jgi:hypothetical protein
MDKGRHPLAGHQPLQKPPCGKLGNRAMIGGHSGGHTMSATLRALAASLVVLASPMLAVPSALSQEMVDATDPAKLGEILKAFGIARQEANSNNGNPQIDGRADGKAYKLFFYGCTEKANCQSVQFWAYWDVEVAVDRINAWNRDTRYGKVYLDEDKDLVLEYDINLAHGASDRNFEESADIWVRLLGKVDKELASN